MATYCMSDIHGHYNEFLKMLEIINFNKDDTLYLLGDNIDRGPDSCKMIQCIKENNNIISLLGNHEDMMFNVLNSYDKDDEMFINPYNNHIWLSNGGDITMDSIEAFINEKNKDEYETYQNICHWIKSLPLYIELIINNKHFFLSHSGINNLKPLSKQKKEDYIWTRYFYKEKNLDYKNLTFIFGHTPTSFINKSKENEIMKFSFKNNVNLIDIDGGIYQGIKGRINCIKLDDMTCITLVPQINIETKKTYGFTKYKLDKKSF